MMVLAAIAAMQGMLAHGVDDRFTTESKLAERAMAYAEALARKLYSGSRK